MGNSKQSDTENQPLHDDAKLLSISSWSSTASWVALACYILAFLGRLLAARQDFSQDSTITVAPSLFSFSIQYNFWINSLLLLVTGITFFLLLQAVSQGILMLMDLEENGLPAIRN